MAPSAERQDFINDPFSSSRVNSASEEVPSAASSRAPVIELPQREVFDEEMYYDDEFDGEARDLRSRAIDAVAAAKDRFSKTYASAREHVRDAYTKVAETSTDLSRRAQRHARHLKEEQPLQLLAIIAGTAFAIGVGLRIWRSSRYEQ